MPFLYKSKMKPTIVYKSDYILINSNNENRALVILGEPYNADTFMENMSKYKFIPNVSSKIHFPSFSLQFPNLTKLTSTSIRDSHYNELKSHRIVFNKLLDLSKIPKEYNHKPIIIDFSMYRENFNKYALKNKKTSYSMMGELKQILKEIVEQLKSLPVKPVLEYSLSNEFDTFLETILQIHKRGTSDLDQLLDNLDVVFTTKNGLFYSPLFSGRSSHGVVSTKVHQLINIQRGLEPLSKDIVEVKLTAEELELPENAEIIKQLEDDTVHLDSDDREQVELQPELVHSIPTDDHSEYTLNSESEPTDSTKEPELDDSDIEDNEDSEEHSKAKENPLNIDGVEDVEDNTDKDILDLASLSKISGNELEAEKLKTEREEFLNKFLPLQVKALESFEKEAYKLAEDKELDTLVIKDDNIISNNVKNVNLNAITSSYYKKQFKADLVNILKIVNDDPEFPAVITKFSMVNNSTPLTKTDELAIELLDKHGKKHNWVVDVAKLSHDGFMLVNGSRKFIAKQATPSPVIKEAPDRVQITTNYRKAFLYRKGEKTSAQADKVLRVILNGDFKSIKKVYGDNSASNANYNVSLPYVYMGSKLLKVVIEDTYEFNFNQDKIRAKIKESKLDYTESDTRNPIGFILEKGKPSRIIYEEVESKEIIIGSSGTSKVGNTGENFTSYITKVVQKINDKDLAEAYTNTKQSLKLSYTEIKIAASSLTLGILVSMYKGLLATLDSYGIKYRVEQKRVAKTESETILAFKDVYLYIDSEYKSEKEILINGLVPLQTAQYSIDETGKYATIYLDYLEEATGSRNTSKALYNFENNMIDPIMLEALVELKLPTNFPDLLLYANTLLGSLNRDRKNDMSHFRIRDSEVIAVAIYNVLRDSLDKYKRSKRSGVVQPISAKRDAVLKMLNDMPNVEGYSTLNPFQEAEIKSKTTFKGPSGLNKQVIS